VVGVAKQHRLVADHVEVAALEITRADHVVDRDAMLKVETDAGGVFAAPARVGHLADHCTKGGHEGAVAGIDLIGVVLVQRQEMGVDTGLAVGIDHLAVLAHRHLLVEGVTLALGVAHQRGPFGVLAHPAEALGRAQQYIAQHACLGFHAPFGHQRRAAALDPRLQGNAAPSDAFRHYRLLSDNRKDGKRPGGQAQARWRCA
jgi:hypothetical protein